MKYLLGLLAICFVVGVVALQAQSVSVVAETGEFVAVAQVSTAANVVPTAFTPAHAGQLLIGTVSNVVYVAKGTTTNDWLQITITE